MKKPAASRKASRTSGRLSGKTAASIKALKPRQATTEELKRVIGGLGSRTAEK